MVPNRIMRGGAVPGALLGLVAALALALALGGCGSGGSSSTAEEEKAADGAILNEVLGRQMAAVDAFGASGLPDLHGPALATARRFGAQEQEHIDSVVKALRGLGAKAEPQVEKIETGDFKTQADYLHFFYEVESGTIDEELSAISNLTQPWPRSLLGATVANQAEHLVLLREALGVTPPEAVPEAFEEGTTPAP
jgi:Ferritin-like domain